MHGTNMAHTIFKEKLGPRVIKNIMCPPNVLVTASTNGWMTANVYHWWLNTVYGTNMAARRVLLIGNYKAHMTGDESKRIVDENCNSELIFIPASCTSLVPPMDVLVNRPFKQHMRDLWVKWFSNHTQRTVHGNPKTPSRQDVINWVSAAWDSIKSDTIQEFSYSVASLTGCISSLLSQPANEY